MFKTEDLIMHLSWSLWVGSLLVSPGDCVGLNLSLHLIVLNASLLLLFLYSLCMGSATIYCRIQFMMEP